MLEERITNFTLNGVFDILNFIVYPLSLCSLKYVPLSTVSSRTKEVLVGQLFNDAQRTAKLIQNKVLNIVNLIPLYALVKSFPLCLINHRTNGHVNAHLISWPSKSETYKTWKIYDKINDLDLQYSHTFRIATSCLHLPQAAIFSEKFTVFTFSR